MGLFKKKEKVCKSLSPEDRAVLEDATTMLSTIARKLNEDPDDDPEEDPVGDPEEETKEKQEEGEGNMDKTNAMIVAALKELTIEVSELRKERLAAAPQEAAVKKTNAAQKEPEGHSDNDDLRKEINKQRADIETLAAVVSEILAGIGFTETKDTHVIKEKGPAERLPTGTLDSQEILRMVKQSVPDVKKQWGGALQRANPRIGLTSIYDQLRTAGGAV